MKVSSDLTHYHAKVEEAFQTHADEMGVANPLDKAYRHY